jgi:hypothetical protein
MVSFLARKKTKESKQAGANIQEHTSKRLVLLKNLSLAPATSSANG